MADKKIWVIAEIRKGNLTRSTSQLFGAAYKIADQKNLDVVGVLMGGEKPHAESLAQKASLVLWINDPGLETYEATRYFHAIWQLIESKGKPVAILASASSSGLELMPRLAIRCETGYASFCVDIWWEGSELVAQRPIYGGRAYEELALIKEPALFTIRSGAFSIPGNLPNSGKVETITLTFSDDLGLKLIERKSTTSSKQDVSEAEGVVAGGRGDLRFTSGAFKRIYTYSQGNPRRINAVCDRALLIAYTKEKYTIPKEIIDEAIKALHGDISIEPHLRGWSWKRIASVTALLLLLIMVAGFAGWSFREDVTRIFSGEQKTAIVQKRETLPKKRVAPLFLNEQTSLSGLFTLFNKVTGDKNHHIDNVNLSLVSFTMEPKY